MSLPLDTFMVLVQQWLYYCVDNICSVCNIANTMPASYLYFPGPFHATQFRLGFSLSPSIFFVCIFSPQWWGNKSWEDQRNRSEVLGDVFYMWWWLSCTLTNVIMVVRQSSEMWCWLSGRLLYVFVRQSYKWWYCLFCSILFLFIIILKYLALGLLLKHAEHSVPPLPVSCCSVRILLIWVFYKCCTCSTLSFFTE